MIILLSPAKTFSKKEVEPITIPLFQKETMYLVQKLKKLSILSIQRKMKLSKALATTVHEYYENFDSSKYSAIYAYDGYAFKGFDVHTLEDKALSYMKDHLYILSGLYGLVRPYDGISYYRLEMQDRTLLNLYTYWKKKVNDYLNQNHNNEWIINLASLEYSKILDASHQILTISFLQKHKAHYQSISMHTKKARGMMARHLVMHQVQDIEQIKSINLDGYTYDPSRSNQHEYVFTKEIST